MGFIKFMGSYAFFYVSLDLFKNKYSFIIIINYRFFIIIRFNYDNN